MQTQRCLIPPTIFAVAFPEFTKFCAVRDFSKAGGVSMRMKIFLLARARKSIASAGHTHIYRMMPSCRSIWMNGFLKLLGFALVGSSLAVAADNAIESAWAAKDPALDTNPTSQFWRGARPVYMENDSHGMRVPGYRTEVRTRWTDKNLYFLFVCPYEELSLKPNPNTESETNQLWNWDVAEVFIGSDFSDIRRYR